MRIKQDNIAKVTFRIPDTMIEGIVDSLEYGYSTSASDFIRKAIRILLKKYEGDKEPSKYFTKA